MFSIKVCKFVKNAQTVGHLHMEISRINHFVLQRKVTVSANICGKHYRGSPLVQEELEVPCQITTCMPGSIVHHHLLIRYETLLRILYIYPKDEQIIGTFPSITNEPPREVKSPQPQRKKNKKTVESRDIRLTFRSRDRQAGHDEKTEYTSAFFSVYLFLRNMNSVHIWRVFVFVNAV